MGPAGPSGYEGGGVGAVRPGGPPAAKRASQPGTPSVEQPPQLPRREGPADETGNRREAVLSGVLRASAKRVSFAFEQSWNTVGSLLGVVGRTMSNVLEPIANLLAGRASASDYEERGPPAGGAPLSSRTGMLAGNALSGAGSSGSGFGPLVAVLVLLMIAVARRGRFWVLYEPSKPGFVPRLVPERPG